MNLTQKFNDRPGTLTRKYQTVCDEYIDKGLISNYDERFEALFETFDRLLETYGHSYEIDQLIAETVEKALDCLEEAIQEL